MTTTLRLAFLVSVVSAFAFSVACAGTVESTNEEAQTDDHLTTGSASSNVLGTVTGLRVDGVLVGEPAKVQAALSAMGLGWRDSKPGKGWGGTPCASYATHVTFFGIGGKDLGTATLTCGRQDGGLSLGLLVQGTQTYAIRSNPVEVQAQALKPHVANDFLFGLSSITLLQRDGNVARAVSDPKKVRDVLRPVGNVLTTGNGSPRCERGTGLLFERAGRRVASLYLCAGSRGRVTVPLHTIDRYGERPVGMVNVDVDALDRIEPTL